MHRIANSLCGFIGGLSNPQCLVRQESLNPSSDGVRSAVSVHTGGHSCGRKSRFNALDFHFCYAVNLLFFEFSIVLLSFSINLPLEAVDFLRLSPSRFYVLL